MRHDSHPMLPLTLAASAALVGSASAATDVTTALSVAIKEGDPVVGIGNLTTIDTLSVNDAGTWLVECDTDNANTNIDQAVVINAAVIAREGDAIAPAGATIGSFGSGGTRLNTAGDYAFNYFLDGLTTTTDSGIYLNTTLVIQEGSVSTAPQFSAGTPYIGFFGARFNDSNQIGIMASIDDVAITSTVDRAIVIATVGPGGSLVSEAVVWKEGDLLPGQMAGNTIADFGTTLHSWDLNDGGQVIFVADLNGSTTTDGVVYRDSTLLAQEGSPSPIAGRNWLTLSTGLRVALSNNGDYAFTGVLDGDTATDTVIDLNGSIYVQEGDAPPDVAGAFTLTSFGSGAVDVDDGGNLYWFGDWNDPITTQDTGIFRNDQLLVQEGVTQIAGQTLISIATVQENFAVSENGEWLVFEGELTGNIAGAFLIHMTGGVTSYCTAGTTTNGCNALISGTGTPSASGSTDFTVTINGVEGQKSGIVFYGISGPTALAWGTSSSFLCVKAPTQRTGTQVSGGTFNACDGTLVLDWDAFVLANPTALGQPFSAGNQVWFQGWFRDPPSPKTTNLSDGLEVTLDP